MFLTVGCTGIAAIDKKVPGINSNWRTKNEEKSNPSGP